ncbi:hypothetical protein AUP68_16328 [Ilyonectria robusta]
MFGGRKFSINRHTGAPKTLGARRFSSGEPSSSEVQSKVHRQFRNAHEGHQPHAGLDASRSSTGVIWCTERASEYGFLEEPDLWANLGQGAPEVEDEIAGCFPRPTTVDVSMAGREYGPTAGIKPLREAVAHLYNEMHRKGKDSQYTWENVAIVPGGRAGLIRIAAVLGNSYLSFFLPDYTAYNEMLSLFKNFAAIPVPLNESDGYHIHPDKIAEEIARGTSVILTSNPRNPTGRVVANPELAEIQDICRGRATFISDEFYSGYNYTSNCDGSTISAAENVEDVDEDDVLIIDGLTKRFRLPGWRIAWILGPKEYINAYVVEFPLVNINVTNNCEVLAPAAATSMVVPAIPSRRPLFPCLTLVWWPLRWLTSRLISGISVTTSFDACARWVSSSSTCPTRPSTFG